MKLLGIMLLVLAVAILIGLGIDMLERKGDANDLVRDWKAMSSSSN